jgi:prepilin-type N-terminal cleavage/methylation domain-containing protein
MVKKAFTLIELIFVIVIIGVLASVAVPKFKNLTSHAKSSGVKSVVTSVQSSVDNIHGKWIINDNYVWTGADGKDHSADFDNTNGFPKKLDSGKDTDLLFSYVLKVPVPSCNGKTRGCWKEDPQDTYSYYYNSNDVLKLEYNATTGTLECVKGSGKYSDVGECEKVVY